MASRLSLLASAASALIKRRASSNATAGGDTTDDARSPAGLLRGMFTKPAQRRHGPPRPPTPPCDWMLNEPGAPPVMPPPPPITGNAPSGDDWEDVVVGLHRARAAAIASSANRLVRVIEILDVEDAHRGRFELEVISVDVAGVDQPDALADLRPVFFVE